MTEFPIKLFITNTDFGIPNQSYKKSKTKRCVVGNHEYEIQRTFRQELDFWFQKTGHIYRGSLMSY